VAFVQLAYSDSEEEIGVAASTNICRVRCQKYWDVVGWHFKLLAVNKNEW